MGAKGIFCYTECILLTVVPSDLCYCCLNMCISFLQKSDPFQAVILLKYALSFSTIASLMICIFQDSHQSQDAEVPQLFALFLMILTSPSIGSKPGPHKHCASSSCKKTGHILKKACGQPIKTTSVKFYEALNKWILWLFLRILFFFELTCN